MGLELTQRGTSPIFPQDLSYMPDLANNDLIQQLEHRHTQLIDELDALNVRIEQTLSSFSPSGANTAESANSSDQ